MRYVVLLVAAIAFIGFAQEYPEVWALVALLVGFVVYFYFFNKRKKKSHDLDRLDSMAASLEALGKNGFKSDFTGLVLQKGESQLFELASVGLTEYRSTGSSYQGGSQGVSVRIAKGLSYRVGASKGSLVRNPEELSMIDEGSVVFTDKRIVFTGPKVSRSWEFAKLLDIQLGTNGQTVNISVSNRQKTSGLVALDETSITPGFLAAIAVEAHTKGIESAKQASLDYAKQIRDLLASEERQTSS